MGDEVITQDRVDAWVEQLERWLPGKLDGMTGEGADELIRHEFIPRSVRITEIIPDDHHPSLQIGYLTVEYKAKQVTGTDTGFNRIELRGAVEVPIALTGDLALEGVRPLDGLLCVEEGLTEITPEE